MIIDASDMIAGRLATFAAKQALLGETIEVVNSENAVISGSRENVFAKFKQRAKMGVPSKGPFVHRSSDKIMRRVIRNMLPYKQPKGKVAFKRIRCWKGLPEQFNGQKTVKIPGAEASKLSTLKSVRIKDISRFLGGNVD